MIPSTVSQVWVLKVGGRRLAVTPRELKEVLEVGTLTPIPLAPPQVLGLLSNQGQVIAVVALGQMLGVSASTSLAAVVENQGSVALAIDEVVGLFPWSEARPADPQQDLGGYALEKASIPQLGETVARLDLQALMGSIREQVLAL